MFAIMPITASASASEVLFAVHLTLFGMYELLEDNPKAELQGEDLSPGAVGAAAWPIWRQIRTVL